MQIYLETLPSPIGDMLLVSSETVVLALDFADCADRMMAFLTRRFGVMETETPAQPSPFSAVIERYFEGDLNGIDALPIDPGGTPFQRRMWTRLRQVPAGTTTTYGTLAADLGNPKASRAVGLANGSNPISIILPCHRVIGSDGSLTGYAGGLARKRWLLSHEAAAVSGQRHQ